MNACLRCEQAGHEVHSASAGTPPTQEAQGWLEKQEFGVIGITGGLSNAQRARPASSVGQPTGPAEQEYE